jgi:subtilisin family serine protease
LVTEHHIVGFKGSLLLACIGAFALTSCATSGLRSGRPTVPESLVDTDPRQLIIVTVDNGPMPALRRPGSTRPVYAGASYQASSAALSTMRQLADEYGLTEVTAWPIQALQVHCAVFRVAPSTTREAVLQSLARDPRVTLAQPMNDFATSTSRYNDPYLAMQSGFRSIDAADAQQWSQGERVRVAVIDTGIDAAHPDFGNRVVVRRNFVDNDDVRFRQDRHGTAVAGIISAAANNKRGIVGVAPAVEIVALKACWQLGSGSEASRCNSLTIAQALAAALEEHARVVNLSLAGPRDPLLNSLVAAGLARGVLFVGAAPADSAADGFPAGAPGMIAVDEAESGHARAGVLRAPGREVVTLVPGNSYDFLSGASMATAHVTGTVALLLARDSGLGRDAVYGLLERSAQVRSPTGEASSINACLALAGLLKKAGCAVPRGPGAGLSASETLAGP